MSSYLNFYLVPKKTKKKYSYDENGHKETEIEISKGVPLFLMGFSRNSEVYQAYHETLNPAYAGMEERYTELTDSDAKLVVDDFRASVKSTEERLAIDYKMLKEGGYSSELWEDIHSMEKYLEEQKEALNDLEYISILIEKTTKDYSDFEKVLINVD